MSDQNEDFPFEKFRHGGLPINISRRSFFSTLLNEFLVYSGKMDGGVGLKLTELGDSPDEELFGIIPVIIAGTEVKINRTYVSGRPLKGEHSYRLFSIHSPALVAFNLMNGENALAEIADALRQETGWDEERSFAYVRGLFLSLVIIGMVQPKY
jgi:hypothetical protein